MKRVATINTSNGVPPRNCYCDLWEKSPETLEVQHVPRGYCGICECCGQPGHLRHAPGGAPYTSAWCVSCYRSTAIRYNIRNAFYLAVVVGVFFVLSAIVRWFGA